MSSLTTNNLQTIMDKVNGVSNEVNSQAVTIAEIEALLEGKAVNTSNLETCHFLFNIEYAPISELSNMELILLSIKEDGTIELMNQTNFTDSLNFVVPRGSFVEFIISNKNLEFYIVNSKFQGEDYPVGYSKVDGRAHYYILAKGPEMEIGFYKN